MKIENCLFSILIRDSLEAKRFLMEARMKGRIDEQGEGEDELYGVCILSAQVELIDENELCK